MLIQPNVNINGDTEEELLLQMLEAKRALLLAVELMKRALPHGRNYQWLGGNSGQRFQDERAEAVRRIEEAQDLAELYYQDAIALKENS